MKSLLWLARPMLALVLSMVGTETLFAGLVAITRDTIHPATDNNVSTNNTLGYEFQVGSQAITIVSLGTWDGDATDGLQATHDVGVWNTAGVLLASATVPLGTATTKIGEYRYIDLLTPLVLAANTNYRIGVQVAGDFNHASVVDDFGPNNDQVDPDWPLFANPHITYVQRASDLGNGGLNFPNGTLSSIASAFDAPNFQFVPEPTSFGLMLAGISLTIAIRVRVIRSQK